MSCPAHDLARSRNFLLPEDVDLIREATIHALPEHGRLVVADLGAGSGTTALAVLAEVHDALIVTVDVSVENLHWSQAAVERAYPKARQYLLHMDSVSAVRNLNGPHLPTAHLVLLDTSHVYENTVEEISAWRSPGRYLWAHDYDGPESEGVRRAIDEAVERRELLQIATKGWSWLGMYI